MGFSGSGTVSPKRGSLGGWGSVLQGSRGMGVLGTYVAGPGIDVLQRVVTIAAPGPPVHRSPGPGPVAVAVVVLVAVAVVVAGPRPAEVEPSSRGRGEGPRGAPTRSIPALGPQREGLLQSAPRPVDRVGGRRTRPNRGAAAQRGPGGGGGLQPLSTRLPTEAPVGPNAPRTRRLCRGTRGPIPHSFVFLDLQSLKPADLQRCGA